MTPQFDSEGIDCSTFAPFVLHDCRDTEWKDLRLEFSDWDWLKEHCGSDTVDGHYLNGYGIEELVVATRKLHGLEPVPDAMVPNSEGDTCYIHFITFDMAAETARLAASMINDLDLMRQVIASMAGEDQSTGEASPSGPSSNPMEGITQSPSHPDAITHQEAVSLRDRMRRL